MACARGTSAVTAAAMARHACALIAVALLVAAAAQVEVRVHVRLFIVRLLTRGRRRLPALSCRWWPYSRDTAIGADSTLK